MSTTPVPRKPVPRPVSAHLDSGRTSTIRLVITEDGQDAPSSPQTKEIAIDAASEDTPNSSQLGAPGDQQGESKSYPHTQDAPSNMQTKEMEMGMANGDTASSIAYEAGDEKPSKRKRFASGALACLGAIKTSTFASTLSRHFNNCLPPQKTYLNNRINRRTLLIIIGVTFLSLLALIIGLAVGLTTGSHNNIPAKPDNATVVTGDFTYYSTGLGACGITNNDNDPIVSISHGRFDENMVDGNPNHNKLCGRKIRAHRVDERTGKEASIELTIADRCVGCAYNDIDVSPVYFDKMAAHDLGRVKVDWYFL
ncbi:DPBB-1 domain containing protein [Pyrenophora tritici-repentis]|uniref:DPBB-1 domain containing protein n=2 Tax=Pyrenophora tritici-repentis TaxID=45151 RepID=A0A2W1GJP6_9PLEO|nr:hypothetical protein PtrV1_03687 [Pyrenophora tritici-repentis]KAF7451365.1 hypothetical protein A1F99_031420 [Pyrenophora tritici-repentis]KAF7575529.1 DPBB-1 domain containing protein [Pyrenophora tritici-repentis]KAG9385727.1 hypothetical protein A1F94_002477 [Pyrenophora tritici-repentis]KAI0574994.1 hypothetical protein Alg215_08274 [Pyrenophora tritici-repentis]